MKVSVQILLLAGMATAQHFHLKYPTPFSDEDEQEHGPCGDLTSSSIFTEWGSSGNNLYISTHSANSSILVSYAPVNSTEFSPLFNFSQSGQGKLCMSGITLPPTLSQATLQVFLNNENGSFYECANIRNSNSSFPARGDCVNATGVSAVWGVVTEEQAIPSEHDHSSHEGHDHSSEGSTSAAIKHGANGLAVVLISSAFYALV